MVNCPNCDAVIDVDEEELDEGDPLTCEECGADLHACRQCEFYDSYAATQCREPSARRVARA